MRRLIQTCSNVFVSIQYVLRSLSAKRAPPRSKNVLAVFLFYLQGFHLTESGNMGKDVKNNLLS